MRKKPTSLAAVLAAILLLTGCSLFRQATSRFRQPDIPTLYREAVKNRDRNPVIIIPGFGGSELHRDDGKIVWGAVFSKEALGHATQEGMRAMALDIDALPIAPRPGDLTNIDDDARAVAPLGHFRADARVTDISFNVYASLMELLGDAGYISPSRKLRDLRYDPDDNNTFTFVYDWRLDIVTNARELERFIDLARGAVQQERRRLGLPERPVQFDVVAHSLGGLVARYYLRYGGDDVLAAPPAEVPWTGAADIDRLVLISTPSLGTMKALRELVRGRSAPLMADFQPALLATMVALYQALPRPRHQLIVDASGQPVELDYMDVEVWLENAWGPFAPEQERYLAWLYPNAASPEERRRRMAGFMRAAFERAGRVAEALDRPASRRPETTLVLFAGDANPTLARALLAEKNGKRLLVFEGDGLRAPGDGTVTRLSALADEREGFGRQSWLESPVPWDWTFFISDHHIRFLQNPTLQNNLLHLLLERPPRRLSAD